jgi:hypothetical protein
MFPQHYAPLECIVYSLFAVFIYSSFMHDSSIWIPRFVVWFRGTLLNVAFHHRLVECFIESDLIKRVMHRRLFLATFFKNNLVTWIKFLSRIRYIRDFEVETIGMKATGRRCSQPRCRGKLKDTVLDWEVCNQLLKYWEQCCREFDESISRFMYLQDALPPNELEPAEKHCREADIVLCLGTRYFIVHICTSYWFFMD